MYHFIYGISSFPLTHIFQDVYCTTNQFGLFSLFPSRYAAIRWVLGFKMWDVAPWGDAKLCRTRFQSNKLRFAGIADASEGLGAVLGGAIAVAMTNGSG